MCVKIAKMCCLETNTISHTKKKILKDIYMPIKHHLFTVRGQFAFITLHHFAD